MPDRILAELRSLLAGAESGWGRGFVPDRPYRFTSRPAPTPPGWYACGSSTARPPQGRPSTGPPARRVSSNGNAPRCFARVPALVPTIARLAETGVAARWIARFEPADIALAHRAIQTSFALPLAAPADMGTRCSIGRPLSGAVDLARHSRSRSSGKPLPGWSSAATSGPTCRNRRGSCSWPPQRSRESRPSRPFSRWLSPRRSPPPPPDPRFSWRKSRSIRSFHPPRSTNQPSARPMPSRRDARRSTSSAVAVAARDSSSSTPRSRPDPRRSRANCCTFQRSNRAAIRAVSARHR